MEAITITIELPDNLVDGSDKLGNIVRAALHASPKARVTVTTTGRTTIDRPNPS